MGDTQANTNARQDRVNSLKRAFAYNLFYKQGVSTRDASLNDCFLAVSYTLRDRMQHLFVNSVEALLEKDSTIQTSAICALTWLLVIWYII